MNQNDQVFESLTKAPNLLTMLDALGIPGWALALTIIVAALGFFFAARELAAWFLKTNTITDEVIRLETMIKDLQGDIQALEQAVLKTKAAVEPAAEAALPPEGQPHFPLHH